ncbi:MAG: hypothetical protein K0Q79_1248 [Flavipsychrobacter sp.]|nr:hypothetical protein [Flavipsychrobacter sp.]
MRNTMIRSLSLLGISAMMAFSVAAQDVPKVKTSDKETKYKSEDLKIKEKKEEYKYKSEDLKKKDEKDERKVKAKVKPMRATSTVRTQIKTGETNVRTKEHLEPISVEPETPEAPEIVAAEPVAVPQTPVKKPAVKKYTARKTVARKPIVARKATTAPRYIVRTKVVRDTVYVPSPPEKVVSIQKEIVHDTVTITRVDTVIKVETKNTYTGYRVPRGDFKKVKLKRDKDDGSVWMKRKEKDGKVKTGR